MSTVAPPVRRPAPSIGATAATVAQPAAKPVAKGLRRASASDIKAPPRIIINAVEGWGKTTLGAYAPDSAILMAKNETGYETLYNAGLVPDRDYTSIDTWEELLSQVDALIAEPGTHQWLVLDALNGFERLCHEYVCRTVFNDDWSEKGFLSFGKGPDVSVAEWLKLIQKLDALRMRRNVGILFLSHSLVKTFKNPLDVDYDRYQADCHQKTWAVTAKWADAVLFGTFQQAIKKEKGERAKGIGGFSRVLHNNPNDAYIAKNRYGLPDELPMPDDHSWMWATLEEAIKKGQK